MNEHTDIEGVRKDLPEIVAKLATDGAQARPIVFGDGNPQAVLISAEQFLSVAEALDDLADAEKVEERERGVNINELPTHEIEDLAEELGVDLRDRP